MKHTQISISRKAEPSLDHPAPYHFFFRTDWMDPDEAMLVLQELQSSFPFTPLANHPQRAHNNPHHANAMTTQTQILVHQAFLPRDSQTDNRFAWRKKFYQRKASLELKKPATQMPQ